MENHVSTEFYLTGKESELRSVRIFIAGLPIDEEGNLKLRDAAKELGLEDEKVWNDGVIEGCSLRNRADYIGFDTECPNQPPRPILDALCRKFPSLKYYFCTKIGDEYFTNDRDEKFFKLPQISVDLLYGESNRCSEEFSSIEHAVSWINNKLHKDFRTIEDVKHFFNSLSGKNTFNYCAITQTRIID